MSLKRKSKLLSSILILIAILILPGCITATYETKINSDGSGRRIQDLAIDESFAGILESSETLQGKKGLEEELKKNMPKDAKYRKFTRDGKVHHQITFDFKDIDELNTINKNLNKSSDVPTAAGARLSKTEFIVFANYKFTDELPAQPKSEMKPEEEKVAKAISVTYKLTLPGKISKAGGTGEVENNTATWHISPTQGGKIEATSRYVRWWLVIVLLVVTLLIIMISGILIFLGLRRKKPPLPEPPETPKPQV